MNKTRQTLIQMYGLFLFSILLNFVPSINIQLFGGVLFFIVLIAVYISRAKEEKGSTGYQYMTYLIKSFWIFSLLLLIGIIAACIFADHTIIYDVMGSIEDGQVLTQNLLEAIIIDYTRTNFVVFILTLGPSVIYLLYRIIKGLVMIQRNQPAPSLKNWL